MHKILGPGNQYVTAAKMALQNSEAMISMDMPAGPSEVLVIADAAASPAHVAADLLSQAEHGPDSQVGHLHFCTSCWLARCGQAQAQAHSQHNCKPHRIGYHLLKLTVLHHINSACAAMKRSCAIHQALMDSQLSPSACQSTEYCCVGCAACIAWC